MFIARSFQSKHHPGVVRPNSLATPGFIFYFRYGKPISEPARGSAGILPAVRRHPCRAFAAQPSEQGCSRTARRMRALLSWRRQVARRWPARSKEFDCSCRR
jgi:hypothetical protein